MARTQSGLNTVLEQKQRLSLKLQRELATVLEKSDSELEEDIRSELQENVALEQENDSEDTAAANTTTDDGGTFGESSDELQGKDYWDEEEAPMRPRRRNDVEEGDFTPMVVNETSLSDYLLEQLNERELTERQQLIARWVVGNLDSNGYLLRSPMAIANDIVFNDGEDVEVEEVQQVIDMVRQLDPPGIGATNLRDCILLQLRRHADDPDTACAIDIVEKHFDAFGNRRYDLLADRLKMSTAQLQRIVEQQIVHGINPKPGSAYSSSRNDHSQYITPDFDLNIEYGEPEVVAHRQLPRLTVSVGYKQASQRTAITSADKLMQADIRSKVERAENFIRLLQLRQDTLRRTMQSIIKRQRDYFVSEGDETRLKPMVMQDIANELGVDVSTISRATTNKYLRMPWGTKPLKFFFHEGVRGGDNGDAVSTYEIKVHLKELIDEEDSRHPLSDQALCDLLQQRGYDIARRTVAKYREQLDIPAAKYRQTY